MVQWKRLGYVLSIEAWPFWLLVIGTLFAWLISYRIASTCAEQILYGGTLLQLCGLLTVAYGIRELRKLFERPNMQAQLLAWVESLKRALGKPVSCTAVVGGGGVVCGGAGIAVAGTTGGLTVNERVDALEKALAEMRKEQEMKLKDLDGSVSRVEGLIHVEGANRQKGDNALLQKLEDMAVGDLQLEVIGFVWLLLGMLGTSVPNEIAKLIPNLFIL